MTLSEALSIILSRLSHLYTQNYTSRRVLCTSVLLIRGHNYTNRSSLHFDDVQKKLSLWYGSRVRDKVVCTCTTSSPRLMLALVPSGVYIMIWNNSDKWVATTITTVDSPTNRNLVHGLLHVLYSGNVLRWVVLVKHLPHGLYNAFDTLDKHFNNI